MRVFFNELSFVHSYCIFISVSKLNVCTDIERGLFSKKWTGVDRGGRGLKTGVSILYGLPLSRRESFELFVELCFYLSYFLLSHLSLLSWSSLAFRIGNKRTLFNCRFVCGISAYCVIGMLFNKFVNGENGTDVIPQKKLWEKLTHLIKVKEKFNLCGN